MLSLQPGDTVADGIRDGAGRGRRGDSGGGVRAVRVTYRKWAGSDGGRAVELPGGDSAMVLRLSSTPPCGT